MSLWRWLAVALVVGLMGVGLARLRLETDVLALLPGDLPSVEALQLQERHFAAQRDLVLVLESKDAEVNATVARAVAEAVRAAPGLVRWAVWTPLWEEHPAEVHELMAATWMQGDPEEVARRLEAFAPEPLAALLEAARMDLATSLSPEVLARRGYDPLGLLTAPGSGGSESADDLGFSSADGRLRWVLITPAERLMGYPQMMDWLARVRQVVAAAATEAAGNKEVRIRYTGGPAFTAEIAAGMDRDMRRSVLGTGLFIAGLFAWVYRRLRPLAWLLALLGLTLLATLALGGLVLGRLNAVSLGFAAILLGLAVDYGLVLYQESIAHSDAPPAEVQRRVRPGILWSAATTAAAFGVLAWGGLPGLTQLGILVAGGTLLAAGILLNLFLRPGWMGHPHSAPRRGWQLPDRWAWVLTGLLPAMALVSLVLFGWPRLDHSADALNPVRSEAHQAWETLRESQGEAGLSDGWLVADGPSEAAVAARLHAAGNVLDEAAAAGTTVRYQLPTALWPDPERQRRNRPRLAALAADRDRLESALKEAGFSEEAFRMAAGMLKVWEQAGAVSGTFWPTNALSTWTYSRFAAREVEPGKPDRFLALGRVHLGEGPSAAAVRERLRSAGLWVGGAELLGEELFDRVMSRLPWVGGLTVLMWAGVLWLAFRSLRGVVLASAGMAGGVWLLLGWMALVGWEWNLMNLMALPLLLGAGTDYAIHLQLALRRHGGDVAAVQRTTGRAILFCAATTVAGFASLAGSNNAGLSSLGGVCAAGLVGIYVVSGQLLPVWWRRWHRRMETGEGVALETTTIRGPSVWYDQGTWQVARRLARGLPQCWLRKAAALAGLGYAIVRPARRRVVIGNLLPLVNGDERLARRASWRLFAGFGRKLADLWAYESGKEVVSWFQEFTGWEHLEALRGGGKGVLLLTLHLGNWELGAPLLAARGISVVVITGAEPGVGFTEMRQAARARWGIETLIVGEDPFAFIEVIRRLQAGAVVALLMDRPPAAKAVEVALFGRSFAASMAGAELARATGCHLVPTVIVAVPGGYAARVLAPLPHDPAALGRRENRVVLTQDILRAFEPMLRQHPDQWFHFVPVWPPLAAS